MKLSNFKYEGEETGAKFARVDVTTGLFFKKTVRRKICNDMGHWFFVDNGHFTPGYQAENLYRSWRAKKSLGAAE
jgi:hypothetical protein